ncbi:restriction endonuclease PLD domain-containing protein [Guptibacillus hwajinpoensis]|uniref:restriction endonuclease PLD domain-containing protein n=1 Tax=Guptibacillus hwajinpoensis TaxID=208199 RepID=UPI0024B37A7E|nr:restriction endonuclease PLD domain-containing protein [Pseudalkalibacillus hwajinpoensis]
MLIIYTHEDIYRKILRTPYEDGLRTLKVLSGYASAAFVYHFLDEFPDVNLELTIGMAKKDGINTWNHQEFVKMTKESTNIKIYYYTGAPPIHIKALLWENQLLIHESQAFIGSANFSWNGFRDHQELMTKVDSIKVNEIISNTTERIECVDSNVEEYIKLHYIRTDSLKKAPKQENATLGNFDEELPFVDLSLKISGKNEIHEKSGLNWGQRERREHNQAYIPVSTRFNKINPDFFPNVKEEFTIITDDNESLVCVMAQANRKAIHTCRNNSILGKYFRRRLGVPLGSKVKVSDLENYGRDYVRMYKIDNETYFMDFKSLQ